MIRVLFVCLGNICRSPMAEAVFRYQVREKGLDQKIEVDSAGTGAWHIGQSPHIGTQEKLKEKQIPLGRMKGRRITLQDLKSFDYLIAMDAENLGELHRMARADQTGHIARILDFASECEVSDVPDPFYDGGFDYVYELIEKGCQGLLDFILTHGKGLS